MHRSLLLALFALGCGDSPQADTDPPPSSTTTMATVQGNRYTSDWDGVDAMLQDHCVSCHAADGISSFLVFPDRLALDLVTESAELVVPGDAASSPLWQVISGEIPEGSFLSPMPPSGLLDPSDRDHIREWIDAGAAHPFAAIDLDGDGFSTDDGDCDETDATIHPGADEVCGDGIDNDCSGDADGSDAVDATTWYPDGDQDSWGSAEPGVDVTACEAPADHVDRTGDCDDGDPAYNPEALEDDCTDPNDYNCDGSVGFADADNDGWAACEDCDDTTALANPDGIEVCGDGLDNDCSGSIDGPDAVDAPTWYADLDGDGHGNLTSPALGCTAPANHVSLDDDCDDLDPNNFPGNAEVCDTFDNDCSGAADDGAIDATDWWPDTDQDGFGDLAATPVNQCDAPLDHVDNNGDCLDSNPFVNPDQPETPGNSLDDNCNGQIDESPPTMSGDVQPILDVSCNVGCHGAVFPSDGLSLTNAYGVLVNVPSSDVPTMDLVEPGSPQDSYLWHKLEGTHLSVGGSGVSMPKGSPLLSLTDRQVVEQWIVEGALP